MAIGDDDPVAPRCAGLVAEVGPRPGRADRPRLPVAVGLALFSRMGVDTAIWWMYGPILFLAAGMALAMTPAHHPDHVGGAAAARPAWLGHERHHP